MGSMATAEGSQMTRAARAIVLTAAIVAAILLVSRLSGCSKRAPETTRTVISSLPTPQAGLPGAQAGLPGPTAPAAVGPTGPPTAPPKVSGLAEAAPSPSPSPPPQVYTVQRGDTLSGIAARFGVTLEAIIAENQIANPNLLRPGQNLQIPAAALSTGPALRLLPDSEFVNGPAYVDFDVESFVAGQGGYLADYYENVGGEVLSGPEIVSLVVRHHSVGPRLLLALLELKGGWVTDPDPGGEARSFPLGYKGGGWQLLSYQLAWAADRLNQGYYGWRGRGMTPITWADGRVTTFDPGLNAATAGLHYFLSLNASRKQWETWVGTGAGSLLETYERLFGDPWAHAVEPLIPAGLTMPEFSLPWSPGELWYYTGGPHGGWDQGSAWAALDFVPSTAGWGCAVASAWATAAAPGLVTYSRNGEVVIDLDGDGHEETGWVLFYLHVASKDRVPAGTWVERGDPIGHPSCEGGVSQATHLHIARKYNGEWIAADGPLPFILSGWRAGSSGQAYNGTLTRGEEVRTACECRLPDYNGIFADP
jgi:LasA protease